MAQELTFAEVMASTVPLAQASEQSQIPSHRLRNWIAEGKLPAVKLGGRLRINPSDLDRLVEPVVPSQAR